MNIRTHKRAHYACSVSNYIRSHKVSLALFLFVYGVFYLSSVVLSGWTVADWVKELPGYPRSFINPLLPRSFIPILFFVTSFPALIVGAMMLCLFSIRGIRQDSMDIQYIAILLTAFGFTYQVIGAWPLGKSVDFPWYWQKQIVSNGPIFAWILYLLSLILLIVGSASLYMQSRIYHQKHPEVTTIEN